MKVRTLLKAASLVGTGLLVREIVRQRRWFNVAGSTVVITGGSRGLGLVLARTLVQRNARVAICARDEGELVRARDELAGLGGDVMTAVCDLTDRDEALRFIQAVEDDFGPIDVLVNNAGIIQVGPLETMTADDFDKALDVNLRGPLHATLAVLPKMRARRAGRIVNIASVGGKIAVPHLAPYTASKFALVGLSQAMRAELAKDNVFVTTVSPGLMRTGSPRRAWFKGNIQAEYAWFTIGDSLPVTSISAESAAAQIITAFTRGQAELVISAQAKLAALAAALAPGAVAEVMQLVARILPAAGAAPKRTATEGRDAISDWAPSRFTKLGDEAADKNNEN
ncbi:MAG TPA: SDR family oxidoreductase [Kofleriaceae bacterium]